MNVHQSSTQSSPQSTTQLKMSYRTTIISSESENEHFSEPADTKVKPLASASKIKTSLKRSAEKTSDKKIVKKKQMKTNASYRDNVGDRLRSEEYDEEVFNSLTFRQGDGIITIKTTMEEKPTDYWVITHYKCSNIENVPVKDRWKFSEAGVKLHTSDKSKDQTLNVSLNQTMQSIFDTMLQDPERRTIKSKIIS